MTNTPDEPLSDDQMSTEQGEASHGDVDITGSAPQEGLGGGGGTDADGTDADGTDGDSSDSTDGDSTDADGTDGDSSDSTDGDSTDADGTDGAAL